MPSIEIVSAWECRQRQMAALSAEDRAVALEIDLALVKEAYEAKLAGHPSVGELPIYADERESNLT